MSSTSETFRFEDRDGEFVAEILVSRLSKGIAVDWPSMETAFADSDSELLVLNMGNVTYLSSEVLGKIVALNRRVAGKLRIDNLSDITKEVFRVSCLDRILTIS